MSDGSSFALLQAVSIGNIEQLKTFIQDGVNVNVRDLNGQTPLIIAAEKGHLSVVEELVECDTDPNETDEDGWTALVAASKEGHTVVVALLLQHGADYNISDLGGWTPLVWASYKGFAGIVKELIKYGADPNIKGEHDMTALIWAAGRGHHSTVIELIEGGAEPEVADKYGTSALIWACRKGHYDVIKVLMEKGADCNTAGTHGWTPLIMAAKGGYADVVAMLLTESPNVNAVDQDGRSALAWSGKEGHNEIVVKLLQKGAFLNMPDRHGDTPLILGSKEGHSDVAHTLLASYADIEMVGSEGKTPLYVAVEKGHVGVVNELLSSGANMESLNKDGETPILRGAKKKHTQCVKLLLEKGANINAVDKKGDNLLHIIVRNGFTGMCEVVLNDPKHAKLLRQPNKSGETPFSIDGKNKHKMLIQPSNEFQHNNQHDYSKMDLITQQEILLCTLGKFLVEPSLCIPMTIGIYSRWGSGKSSYLQQLVELLEEYKQQVPLKPFTITILLVLACFTAGINFGIILWAVKSQKAGIICGICVTVLLIILFLFTRLSITSVDSRIRQCGISITILFHRVLLLLKLVYCVPPCIEEFRSILPVHLVMVDLSQSAFLADSPMSSLVSFTRELNDAVETDLGIFIPRLYRIFQSTPYRNHAGTDINFRPHWKLSCCCIPSFLITVLIFLCLWIGIILYNVYSVQGPSTVIAIQIACCCVFGGGLISYILRSFVMTYCLCLPMKKRVKIVANQAGIQEETFLSVLKQELDLYVDMLECLDGFNHRQTRVVIHIDLVDSLEQQKVLALINTINLLVTEPGHPFILVISVDPRLLIKAIDQTLSNMQGPVINPCEYLKNMVDLPFYINEYPKLQAERLIPSELCQQLEEKLELSENEHEYDGEWLENDDLVSGTSHVNELENGHIPLDNGVLYTQSTLERSVKFPSNDTLISSSQRMNIEGEEDESISEDISHLLRNNENNTLNDVKRIMNVVSLTGRLLRYHDVPFQWTRLAIWVSFCDGWPYKASWITLLCLDATLELPGSMSIRRLHSLFGFMVPIIGDRNLGIENSNAYFDTFIASHRPVINVNDARSFADFMFYIDPTIRKLMIDYLLAMRSSKQSSLQQNISTASFMLPSPNNPYLWTNSVNRELLVRMTVDDVASQLLEIEGMDESLLQEYKNRLLDNNINGRVLAACDLNELQEVMLMKFGDWQLFRAWISASRSNDQQRSNRYEEKMSTDRSTGCLNSFLEGSQSEWSPGTPKQSTCGSTRQDSFRLPSLSEKVDTANEPYCSHSPRITPHLTRKLLKHSKTAMSVSQDSESGSAQHAINRVLHHSADSGFASTEVDQNHRLMLSLQRQMCVSDSHKLIEQNENIQLSPIKCNKGSLSIGEGRNTGPPIIETRADNSDITEGTSDSTPLIPITVQEGSPYLGDEINRKLRDKIDHIDSDNNTCENNETNDSNVDTSISRTLYSDSDRPPSLSEVPMPPLSMLSDTITWPMNPPAEFDDHQDSQPLPSPPSDLEHMKLIFRNPVANRDVSSGYPQVTSDYQHPRNLMDNEEDMCTRSEPYAVDFDSSNESSLRKSASMSYYDKKRNNPRLKMSPTSEKEGLLDQEESKL